jgi:hypothetical protein
MAGKLTQWPSTSGEGQRGSSSPTGAYLVEPHDPSILVVVCAARASVDMIWYGIDGCCAVCCSLVLLSLRVIPLSDHILYAHQSLGDPAPL